MSKHISIAVKLGSYFLVILIKTNLKKLILTEICGFLVVSKHIILLLFLISSTEKQSLLLFFSKMSPL